MMVRCSQKNVWLFCALLLLVQSLLPASAVAYVSVRCVGTPAIAPDCAQSLIPVEDTTVAETHLASMSCCRHMDGQGSMSGCPHTAGLSPRPFALSAPTCLVTVSPLSTERALSNTSVRQWMLNASPSLAPPAASLVQFPLCTVAPILPVRTFDLPPSQLTHSHGLRAPPVA